MTSPREAKGFALLLTEYVFKLAERGHNLEYCKQKVLEMIEEDHEETFGTGG